VSLSRSLSDLEHLLMMLIGLQEEKVTRWNTRYLYSAKLTRPRIIPDKRVCWIKMWVCLCAGRCRRWRWDCVVCCRCGSSISDCLLMSVRPTVMCRRLYRHSPNSFTQLKTWQLWVLLWTLSSSLISYHLFAKCNKNKHNKITQLGMTTRQRICTYRSHKIIIK